MSKILDPKFRYTPAASTDIRKTFAKVRREMEAKKRERQQSGPAVIRFRQRSD